MVQTDYNSVYAPGFMYLPPSIDIQHEHITYILINSENSRSICVMGESGTMVIDPSSFLDLCCYIIGFNFPHFSYMRRDIMCHNSPKGGYVQLPAGKIRDFFLLPIHTSS